MNKERYNQIVDEVCENFEKWYNEHSGKEDYTGYYVPTKEEFIRLIKTNPEFSEKWGLKIEERELSLEERRALVTQEMFNQIYNGGGPESLSHSEINQWNIPTKLLKITYKGTKIESYEY
jgi:hypothetical protein